MNARYLNGAWNGNLRATRYGVTELTVVDGDTGGASYHTNHIDPTVVVDLEAGYDLTAHLTLSAGAKNLLDRHPDKAISQGYSHAYVYPSFSPFGINGAYYYVKGSYTF